MKIGDTYEVNDIVVFENTAAAGGSGKLPVFGTPFMVQMMENAAFLCIDKDIPEGKSSVGTQINVSHVSSTPIGMKVRVVAEITNISENQRMVDFKVTAYDERGLIGEGTHTRYIITVDRFIQKAQAKLGDGE